MEKKQRMVRLLELMMCRGTMRTMRLMTARHDAPSSSHARTVTTVSSSGPSHKKCRKIIDIKMGGADNIKCTQCKWDVLMACIQVKLIKRKKSEKCRGWEQSLFSTETRKVQLKEREKVAITSTNLQSLDVV
jgi:hypothetical protein